MRTGELSARLPRSFSDARNAARLVCWGGRLEGSADESRPGRAAATTSRTSLTTLICGSLDGHQAGAVDDDDAVRGAQPYGRGFVRFGGGGEGFLPRRVGLEGEGVGEVERERAGRSDPHASTRAAAAAANRRPADALLCTRSFRLGFVTRSGETGAAVAEQAGGEYETRHCD